MTLDDLRKIAEAATPGPWEYRGDYFGIRQVPMEQHLVSPNKYEMEGIVPGEHIRPEDAEFIETFDPKKVLELLDQIEQLQAVVRDSHDDCVYQARLAAVEEVHERREYWTETGEDICDTCSRRKQNDFEYWPCETIKAARGE